MRMKVSAKMTIEVRSLGVGIREEMRIKPATERIALRIMILEIMRIEAGVVTIAEVMVIMIDLVERDQIEIVKTARVGVTKAMSRVEEEAEMKKMRAEAMKLAIIQVAERMRLVRMKVGLAMIDLVEGIARRTLGVTKIRILMVIITGTTVPEMKERATGVVAREMTIQRIQRAMEIEAIMKTPKMMRAMEAIEAM